MLDSHDEHPLDRLVPDPTGMPPLCSEVEFDEMLERMVTWNAPRLFAIVQVYGDRVDRRIAGWGMDFEDHAEVVSVDRSLRMKLNTPEEALLGFNLGNHVRARLVWPCA